MPKYKVLTPVDLDNKRYEPDKTTPDIDDDTAAPLLAVNAIVAIDVPKKGAKSNTDAAAADGGAAAAGA